MIYEFDDFGSNHNISDMCQSHDCRDKLVALHQINPAFKVTLFAIPGEMTPELLEWSSATPWVELAVHGFFHTSNYECEKMGYEEFAWQMERFRPMIEINFVKGFRAPGWQISDDAYQWLLDNGWWVADQAYNNDRRPPFLKAYVNNEGRFSVYKNHQWRDVAEAHHGHTWDCVGNGIYETFDYLKERVATTADFQFVSEIFI